MTQADDDELMARVKARDQAAFDCLVRRHLAGVHRYLLRLTASPADADELSQETFLRLWLKAAGYRPGRVRLTTWLHRVAHNLAVDELRRRPRDHDTWADTGNVPDPQALALSSEAGETLNRAIAALPENQRAALLLCQVQGFSNGDAARILGVTVRSLESLVARARRTLRGALLETDGHEAQAESRG